MQFIKSLMGSLKFRVMVAAVIVWVASFAGLDLAQAAVEGVLLVVAGWLGVSGAFADLRSQLLLVERQALLRDREAAMAEIDKLYAQDDAHRARLAKLQQETWAPAEPASPEVAESGGRGAEDLHAIPAKLGPLSAEEHQRVVRSYEEYIDAMERRYNALSARYVESPPALLAATKGAEQALLEEALLRHYGSPEEVIAAVQAGADGFVKSFKERSGGK